MDFAKKHNYSFERDQYETFVYEFYKLMLDIEDGILNWNKLRLAAFKVKDYNEVMSYLMYIQLEKLKVQPYAYECHWNYKFVRPVEELKKKE